MPFPPIASGAGGGGFTLGPVQNVFTGADRAAAETARDTYFTANPSNLTSYNNDTNLNIRLEYSASGNTVALFQVRNEAGNAWLDNSSAIGVAGPAGQDGQDGTATIPGLNDGTITQVTSGALAASSLVEQSDRVRSTKQLEAPGGGGVILSNWDARSEGLTIGFQNLSDGRMYHPVASELITAGSQRPAYIELGPVATQFEQNLTDVNIADTVSQYQFSNANPQQGTATRYILTKGVGVGTATNCNLIIRLNSHADTNPVIDYKRDHPTGAGFDLGPGDNTIDLPAPAFFGTGVIVYITIVSDNGDNLELVGTNIDLGDGLQNIPAGRIEGRAGGPVTLAKESDLRTLEQLQDAVAAMFTGGTHNGITFSYDDTDGFIDATVTGGTPQPGASISGFSINIPATVNTGTDLNNARTIQFTTVQTSQIASMELVVTTGTNQTLSVPANDGSHSQGVTLAGIDTSSAATITFQIRGTTTGGQTIMSNSQTVTVRAVSADEQAYYGTRATNDFATVATSLLTSVDVQPAGSTYTISGSWPATEFIGILEPTDRPISSIVETAFNQETLSSWTRTANARTIAGQAYDLLTQQNNGPSGTFEFRVTHA